MNRASASPVRRDPGRLPVHAEGWWSERLQSAALGVASDLPVGLEPEAAAILAWVAAAMGRAKVDAAAGAMPCLRVLRAAPGALGALLDAVRDPQGAAAIAAHFRLLGERAGLPREAEPLRRAQEVALGRAAAAEQARRLIEQSSR